MRLGRHLVVACLGLLVAAVGAAAAAPWVDYVNARYRTPLGLQPLVEDSGLSRAASAHAAYLDMNADLGHYEEPGLPGFTGIAPWDRCAAAGSPFPNCGEVAIAGVATIEAAIDGWMRTPYHGAHFVGAMHIGCGLAGSKAVCNDAGDDSPVFSRSSPINSPTGWLRVWPAAGMRDIPTRWWGGETPDPLSNYVGDRSDVGPVFFVRTGLGARITLAGPAGAIPILRPGASATTDAWTYDPSSSLGRTISAQFFAGKALVPGTEYALTVTRPDDGVTEVIRFRTRDEPATPDPVAEDAGESPLFCPSRDPGTCATWQGAVDRAAERRDASLAACRLKPAGRFRARCTTRANASYALAIARAEAALERADGLAACRAIATRVAKRRCTAEVQAVWSYRLALGRSDQRRSITTSMCPTSGLAAARCRARAQAVWGQARTSARIRYAQQLRRARR